MDWETRFLQSTPGEVIVNSKPREVVQSCWVGAEPEKHTNISLIGWTDSVAAMFGIQKARHLEFAGQKDCEWHATFCTLLWRTSIWSMGRTIR